MARTGAWILVHSGLQLRHVSLGAVTQPPGVTLGEGLQPYMLLKNVM